MGIITYTKFKKVEVIGKKIKELIENKNENMDNEKLS